jgi:uncharacterized protein YciI
MKPLILLALTFWAAGVTAQEVQRDSLGFETFTVQEGGQTFTLKKYYLVFLKEGPVRNQTAEEAQRIQSGHLAHLNSLAEQGLTLITGPMGDAGPIKGMVVYNVPDEARVKELAEADPAVKSGRLVVEIHPWWTTPGSCLK